MHITLASGERHTFRYYEDLKNFLDNRRALGDRAWVVSVRGSFGSATKPTHYKR